MGPQPLNPAQFASAKLKEEEQAALQLQKEIQQSERTPRLPLDSGTISFDAYPLEPGQGLQVHPIPSGTDLEALTPQPWALVYGVTFTRVDSLHPGGVWAWRDFWTPRASSTNNIVSTIAQPDPGQPPYFTGSTGTIKATFDPPVKSVSIDAFPSWSGDGSCPTNQPYLQALDVNGNLLQGTGSYARFPIDGCANGNQPNPQWGVWATLTLTRPQADIGAVAFSVEGNMGNGDVYVVFDNLSFSR